MRTDNFLYLRRPVDVLSDESADMLLLNSHHYKFILNDLANRQTRVFFLKGAELQELTLLVGAELDPEQQFSSVLLHSASLWTLSLIDTENITKNKEINSHKASK